MGKANSSNLWGGITILVAVVLIGSSSAQEKTIHVKSGGTGDGSSWSNAYGSLQDALDSAEPNDSIWVAEGTYTPSQLFDPCDPRTAIFQMKNGVGLYGGFSSVGDPNWESRDWEKYETVLSGDLSGNDIEVSDPCDLLSEPTRAENSYHVLTGSGIDVNSMAILDGFTITAGNANIHPHSEGGGMHNDSGSPMVTNCTFISNSANIGGGMYNTYSCPTVADCAFIDNSASSGGGGMCNNHDSNSTVAYCNFIGNTADNYGGGIANNYSSSPTVTYCTFTNNSAKYYGAGMYNISNSSPMVANCTFIGNSSWWGGGLYNGRDCNSTVAYCNFIGNTVDQRGGGMYNSFNSSTTVTNCAFVCNFAYYNGGGMRDNESNSTVINCTFIGNETNNKGGGIDSFDSITTVSNCILWSNTAKTGPQINSNDTSVTTVSYSDVEGGYTGTSNINADPCFVDSHNPDPNLWNLRLKPGSPCIDTGDPLSDYSNEPMPNGSRINMGAFGNTPEATCSMDDLLGDISDDGVVNMIDLSLLAAHWMEVDCADSPDCANTDLNHDGQINSTDVKLLAEDWLKEL